ncbi:hypothetical protein [Lysobacter sp. CFH 32150]|uniref:hypothetical protein n=1 Tax=Lysobacter sp. CFH 32150 TaxID=2927128 RepID=UPI001FA6A9CC|nr:hypothetical protein [Lysobacter sp. CFH 32150]MCI4567208.1 hypothetical protein [Lysobacter sp. CFH 32150]
MKVESKNPLQRKGVECQVCTHPDRASMELGLANKVTERVLAKRYGVSRDSLGRHRRHHMTPDLLASLITRGRMSPTDLENLRIVESEGSLQHLVAVRGRLYGMMDYAESINDYKAASAIGERIVKVCETIAKLLGDIRTGTVNVTNNMLVMPEFHAFRTSIMQALKAHPEAREAVALALRSYESPALPTAETPEERAEAEPVLAKAREVTRQNRAKKIIEGEARRVGPSE